MAARPVEILSREPQRFSIALCTCDGAVHLQAQLDSLAAQGRLPDELVVCDDASTDSTPTILRDFASRAPFPVRIHLNPSRLGVTKNFEQAASLCTGDIIFFCDQDDVWLPEKVANFETVFVKNPNLAAAFSNAQVVEEDLAPAGYTLWDSVWFTPRERSRFRKGDGFSVLLKHAVAAGATIAFRSSYRDLLLPIPNLRPSHDIWTILLLTAVADVAMINQELIRYRLHARNTVGLRNWSIPQQIAKAKEQIAIGAFDYAVELHSAAAERLRQFASRYPPNSNTDKLLQEKVDHSRLRHSMPERWLKRLPVVFMEACRLHYFRYSYGWKSVAQDLFLR